MWKLLEACLLERKKANILSNLDEDELEILTSSGSRGPMTIDGVMNRSFVGFS